MPIESIAESCYAVANVCDYFGAFSRLGNLNEFDASLAHVFPQAVSGATIFATKVVISFHIGVRGVSSSYLCTVKVYCLLPPVVVPRW